MIIPNALEYPFPFVPHFGDVQEIIPGIIWIRMPLPFALDHINLWLINDGTSQVIIDAGLGTTRVRKYWEDILKIHALPISRVIVTHYHPDHLGLAAWLAQRDQTALYMTDNEYASSCAIWHQLAGYAIPDMLAHFAQHGLKVERLHALEQQGNSYRRGVPVLPAEYSRIADRDILSISGHEWQIIVGYGHSPEHASLYCSQLGILISGDMLLPKISTNISVFAAKSESDPLGLFLDSLMQFHQLPDDTLVLPSHGLPFRGIKQRIAQLQEHHAQRCEELLTAIDQSVCAAELLPILFARELDTHQTMFAMGEAIAHLNYLTYRHRLIKSIDNVGIMRFSRLPS